MDTQFGAFEVLTQYGALGIITLALGVVVWFLLKRQLLAEDNLRTKVNELQSEINTYIRNDQNKVTTAIENNTKAMNDLRDLVVNHNLTNKK